MKHHCTAAILCGGMNSRFSGHNKALFRLGEKRIIDYIYHTLNEIFEEIILITNNPLDFIDKDVRIVTDVFAQRSSLTGIHASLFYSNSPYTFCAACDAPFLKKEIVHALLRSIDRRRDIIIPETPGGVEPLCAIYSQKCLPFIERLIEANQFKIRALFQDVRVKKISLDVIRNLDDNFFSFLNINTPEDLRYAQTLFDSNHKDKL